MPSVTVTAPSRLHFGLYAFADSEWAYGGVGAMIDRPGLRLVLKPADQFEAGGLLAERVEAFAKLAAANFGWAEPPCCQITVETAPAEHVGLGLGTQLGLAVAAGLNGFVGNDPLPPEQLAVAVGRGKRSAVGTHGFELGGMILDGGHEEGQPIGRLMLHVDLPTDWRFLLVTLPASEGLSGSTERTAFANLPPIPPKITGHLLKIAIEQLAPAAQRNDFAWFASSVSEYGRLAGGCYAGVQEGPFASLEIADLVERLVELGVRGYGQSSWGPTVFSVLPSQSAAESLQAELQADPTYCTAATLITAPSQTGYAIRQNP